MVKTIELINDVIKKKKHEMFDYLKCEIIYSSLKDVCYKITLHSEIINNELYSNQEEEDTKVCLQANHAVITCPGKFAIVSNPSGDVDIHVILLSTTIEHHDRIITDFNRKDHPKIINF